MNYQPRTAEAYKLLHDGILAFSRAEQVGVNVDLEYIRAKKDWVSNKMDSLEDEFKQTNLFKHWQHSVKGKINISSGTQLAHFLYDVKKIEPVKFTVTGKGSTDEDALTQLDIPELDILLNKIRYKKCWDVLNGFEKEQVNSIIHPFFNLHLVRTFRSSSDSPNFQNIPKKDEEMMQICRRAIIPRKGNALVEIDFSGLEVKIAVCYHKDPNMIRYIQNPKSDMHSDMAKQIFLIKNFDKDAHGVLRQAAKNGFVFAQFYGDYYKNCAKGISNKWVKLPQGRWTERMGIEVNGFPIGKHMIESGIKSFDDFTEHLRKIEKDFWENRFPDYDAWRERHWEMYQKYGYFDLLTGFRCSGVMKRNDCINYPVQGAAFHCNLWSFIELDRIMREEHWKTTLIGQIHDSIILDANPDELEHVIKIVKRVTIQDLPKTWKWIIVPLNIDIERTPINVSWAEKEKI